MMQADSDSNLRIFLRNSETGEFYKRPDQWVSKPEEATPFETHGQASEERQRIPKPKLETIAFDKNERPRFGLRLWKNGQ